MTSDANLKERLRYLAEAKTGLAGTAMPAGIAKGRGRFPEPTAIDTIEGEALAEIERLEADNLDLGRGGLACIDEINRLRAVRDEAVGLLVEARNSGYLKTRVTYNETGLEERVDAFLAKLEQESADG